MEIIQVKKITPEILESLHRLIPQLDPAIPLPTEEKLIKTVASPSALLYICRVDNKIVATAGLFLYTSITGDYAHIEDLVVDKNARGKGIGKKLLLALLTVAKAKEVKVIHLTSRPARKTANRLYKKIGFIKRETNVYRFTL